MIIEIDVPEKTQAIGVVAVIADGGEMSITSRTFAIIGGRVMDENGQNSVAGSLPKGATHA